MAESRSESLPVAQEEEDDSEWEYEYHETETESFYVTLDISAAADYNHLGPRKKKWNPLPPRVPQPTTSPGPQDNVAPTEQLETLGREATAPMDIDPNLEQPEDDTTFFSYKDRVQILDLHTQNPLISYQNQLYSCEWTSTLGTDILLAAPASDFPHPVLREKPNVSVLATSSIKLMGRPAQISSRHTAEEGIPPSSTPAPENPAASANTAGPPEPAATPPVIKIPLGPTPGRARQKQATFLERLIAIKAKKGEKDNVTVYTQKVNQGTGWRSQRKAAEATTTTTMEDAEGGENILETASGRRGKGVIGRPRGSKRTKGPRTAKGGLFRDYRPQLWDTPGADIRAGATTPESWDQLDGGGGGGGVSDDRQTSNNIAPSPLRAASASPIPPPPFRPARSVHVNGEEEATPNSVLAPQLALASGEENVFPADDVEMVDDYV